MKFECPNCKKSGQVDDSKVPESGVYATCPQCNNRFMVKREAPGGFEFEPVEPERNEIRDANVNITANPQNLNAEFHPKGKPWRRYWARTIDSLLLSLPISFLFGLLFPQFTAHTLNTGGELVIGVFILPFIMLSEACILGATGTTFGKWLLNIWIVRKKDGYNVNFPQALKRSILLWVRGLAFGLPLISLFSMGFAAGRIKRNRTASWDDSISANVQCGLLQTWKVCVAVASIVSLIVFCGVLRNFSHKNLPAAKSPPVPVVTSAVSRPTPPAQSQIILRSIGATFIKNENAGNLLVITGEAVNNYDDPRTAVLVTGLVYGDNSKILGSNNTYSGNILTKKQLATMSLDKIEASLTNQSGSVMDNLEVAPGKTIPFMVVIANVPQGAINFCAVLAGSSAVFPKK